MSNHRPITTIFTDLGRVLVLWEGRREWMHKFAQRFCRGLTLQDMLDRLNRAGILDLAREREDQYWRLDTGILTFDDLYRAFLDSCEISERVVSRERFAFAYWCHHRVIGANCEVMQEARSNGIAVVAASNGDGHAAADLVSLETELEFDGTCLSWQVGHKKPAPEFWTRCRESAAARLGKIPDLEECLLIDDYPGYVEGIIAQGGQALLYDARTHDYHFLRKELAARGLPVTVLPDPLEI